MGTKERRERERMDTREKILAAAREMFATKGYDAVTMRAIADHIEYTPTALYHHFPSKHALLTELCERDFDELGRHFRTTVAPSDPVERLFAVGEAYLRFALEYPSQYRFMFMTVLPPIKVEDTCFAEEHNNPERSAYAFLRQACSEAIEQGRFRPEYNDPDQIAQMCWGAIHGIIALQVAKHEQSFIPWRDLRETVRLMLAALMRGILKGC
ncbi:MAG: TetR/AcrR family transcriptional regulator [Candidatus Eisenbacteria bacterium]|nr:TetR/AcrR family transcriptional regulator [Candidatus Eisenbacteria bacterium]